VAQTIPNAQPVGAPLTPYLDAERLDCYRLAVEFQTFAAGIASSRRVSATLRDQLDRASVSAVLCIAEGAGRRTSPDKAHFFTIARGSAAECAAVLDLLVARGLIAPAWHRHGRGLVVRIVQMTSRLIARHTVGGA
jgi:four helix bundle protein